MRVGYRPFPGVATLAPLITTSAEASMDAINNSTALRVPWNKG